MSHRATPRRLALVLEYDGGAYHGSQRQSNAPTVQEALETALTKLTGERLDTAFAGRTDAGVHAQGQVAAFTTASGLATDVFVRGLNAWLPAEIAVKRAVEAPVDFDPRRHATSRTYGYTIYNAPARSPLHRRRAWHILDTLECRAMQEAADSLVGKHDFAAFSRDEGVSTIRCVHRCEVARRGPLVTLEIEANAFLRQQVRRIAGALVQVGCGRMDVSAFGALLRPAPPASAEPLAPAQGLCLLRVSYPALELHVEARGAPTTPGGPGSAS